MISVERDIRCYEKPAISRFKQLLEHLKGSNRIENAERTNAQIAEYPFK